MNWLINNPVALFLQSNGKIGEMVGKGQVLSPNFEAYTGIIAAFAKMFLALIMLLAGLMNTVPYKYGIAIILSAIVIRILLLPLTRIQLKGMRAMQLLQPVMKEIQRYYPNKQDQSAKTMELYQKYQINPLSGCLPMLVMFPILFGVYRALYDPMFAGANFFGIQLMFPVNVTGARNFGMGPDLADVIDVTVAELGLQSHLVHIPDNIPLIGGSFMYWPALILVILYVASTWYMQAVMKKVNAPDPEFIETFKEEMNKGKRSNEPEPPDPAAQMQRNMGFMNIIIILFAFIFSAGALLYFIVQNSIMIIEYNLLPKLAGGPELDPKELKAFIKKAPVMPAQQQALQKGAEAASGNEDNDAKNQEGDLDGTDDEPASITIKRPRKKRKR